MAYTINVEKESASPRRPLLLAVFTFPDGGVLRVSTHNGDTSDGGYNYGGNAYLPRIDDQEIDRLAWISEQGIDRIGGVTIKLSDPDAFIWTNFERSAGKGFKGANLELRLVLFDPMTGEYSTDSFVPFLGVCDQPAMDEKYLTVTANTRLNLTRYMLPTAPIQPRCIWNNPTNAAQRAEAGDPESRFFNCGETRDTTTAPPCAYTKGTCTVPQRFSGSTWAPDQTGSGREYISGGKVAWRNADTSGKFKSYHPLWLGGVAWLDAVVLNQVGDANYTRGEASIGLGEIDVERVIVNGVEISFAPNGRGDFRWHYVNNGNRDGTPNGDRPYNGNGDPYGGLTVIQYLAPRAVIDPASLATVRVLGRRKKLRAYRRIASATGSGGPITITLDGPNEDCAGNPPFTVTVEGNSLADGTHTLSSWTFGPPGTITISGTGSGTVTGGWLYYEPPQGGIIGSAGGGASSPWVLMETLRRTRFAYTDLDRMSFADTAKVCNGSITYTDQNGASASQSRFSTAVALRDQQSASDVVRGIRQSVGALLVPGSDGKLKLQIEGPLAEQQPAAVDGSNYVIAVASKLRTGASANGYVAYRFTESNCWNLRHKPRPIAEAPNRIQFPIQDPSQQYAISSYTLVDSDDVARIDQESPGSLAVQPVGIASQNHALRAGRLGLAKIHRGNPEGDTRGTDWWEWETSFRGCKLQIGQIVQMSSTRLGLTNQFIRLTEIKPSRNYETVALSGHFHNDDWYLDSNGNAADPGYSARGGRRGRFPFAWKPNREQPPVGDPLFSRDEWSFRLWPVYSEFDAEGNAIPKLRVQGFLPANQFAAISAPLLARQGTTASSGGTITGASGIPGGTRRLYAVVSGKDSAGKLTRPSEPCFVDITASGNTNTATIPIVSWDSATDGYAVYAGWALDGMVRQVEGSGKPTSVTLTSLTEGGPGIPDEAFQKILVRLKRIEHAGVFGQELSSVGTNALTILSAGWTSNEWAGYDCSVVAVDEASPQPIANFRVSSNTADTLTVTPDPSTIPGLGVFDVLVMRSQPSVSGLALTDTKWANSLAGAGLTVDEEKGRVVRFIAGPGAGESYLIASNTADSITVFGPWITTPTSASRYIIEQAAWLPETADSLPISNADPGQLIDLIVPANNYRGAQLRVQAFAVDADGNESTDAASPWREIYLFGHHPGIKGITDNYTVEIADHTLLADTTDRAFSIFLLPTAVFRGRTLTIKKISDDTNEVTIVAATGEDIEGVDTLTLTQKGDSFILAAE